MDVDREDNSGGVSSNSSSRPKDPLTWRMDPALSHSDWTIEVVVLPQKKHHCTYHVHKTALSVGPKSSEYFFRLFQSGFAESTQSTSRVELNEEAAKTFPLMLDYLYASSNELFKIEYQDSAPLYHVSDYFEIPSLCETVEEMWQSYKIPCSSLGVLYQHSKIFPIDKLKETVVETVHRNIKSIGKDSSLAQVADSELWLGVIEKNGGTPNEHLCALVADYCASNINKMDVYKRLLQEEGHFEVMSIGTALQYLELEQTTAHRDDGVANGLSDIQNKCIEVLAALWGQLDTVPTEGSLAKLNHPVLVSLLGKTAKKATMDLLGRVPTKIVVSGAGCTAVNGMYNICSAEDGLPNYEMRGRWNGQDVSFSLHLHLDSTQFYRWVLRIDRYTAFYCSNETYSTMTRVPPVSGWTTRLFGKGRDPAPSLEFLYG